jgi:REP element-mobilizing transposase RayT
MVPGMKYDPTIHRRRSIRLQGYDYSQAGAYFVTICTHNRQCLFGGIADRKMRLNDAGRVVQQCWDRIPTHFPHVELDGFVVMPNHVHGIVVITDIDYTHSVEAMVRKIFRPYGMRTIIRIRNGGMDGMKNPATRPLQHIVRIHFNQETDPTGSDSVCTESFHFA